jgi:hypothetical protein
LPFIRGNDHDRPVAAKANAAGWPAERITALFLGADKKMRQGWTACF